MYLTIDYINKQDLSGGLGDRIFGLISCLMIAKYLNRKLLIKWDYPDVSHILDYDNFYDYKITGTTTKIDVGTRPEYSRNIFIDPNIVENTKSYQNILVKTNFNSGQYIYLNPTLGLDKSLYDKDLKEFYTDLYVKYLRPKGLLKNGLNFYQSIFDDTRTRHNKKIIGIHLRCGSKLFGGETYLYSESDADLLIPNILKFMLDKNFNSDEYSIFLLTDHEYLKNRFYHYFVEYEIIYVEGNIIHIDKTNTTNGLDKIFLDQIMLSRTDLMIMPDSNLSRIARVINYKNPCYIYRSATTNFKIINGEIKFEEFNYKIASSREALAPELL